MARIWVQRRSRGRPPSARSTTRAASSRAAFQIPAPGDRNAGARRSPQAGPHERAPIPGDRSPGMSPRSPLRRDPPVASGASASSGPALARSCPSRGRRPFRLRRQQVFDAASLHPDGPRTERHEQNDSGLAPVLELRDLAHPHRVQHALPNNGLKCGQPHKEPNMSLTDMGPPPCGETATAAMKPST